LLIRINTENFSALNIKRGQNISTTTSTPLPTSGPTKLRGKFLPVNKWGLYDQESSKKSPKSESRPHAEDSSNNSLIPDWWMENFLNKSFDLIATDENLTTTQTILIDWDAISNYSSNHFASNYSEYEEDTSAEIESQYEVEQAKDLFATSDYPPMMTDYFDNNDFVETEEEIQQNHLSNFQTELSSTDFPEEEMTVSSLNRVETTFDDSSEMSSDEETLFQDVAPIEDLHQKLLSVLQSLSVKYNQSNFDL
jgi:AraC-like DNA-binding protein